MSETSEKLNKSIICFQDNMKEEIKLLNNNIEKLNDDTENRWNKYDIKGGLSKIDTLSDNQEKIDKRLTSVNKRLSKVETHIKIVQWGSAPVIMFIVFYIAKFINLTIDTEKIIPLGIPKSIINY